MEQFREVCPDASFAVGECMNGDPFELALALVRYGFQVPEIYGTITAENFVYIRHLAEVESGHKGFFPIWNLPCCIMIRPGVA